MTRAPRRVNGVFTLSDTQTDTKTKNGLCRIVWRCSFPLDFVY